MVCFYWLGWMKIIIITESEGMGKDLFLEKTLKREVASERGKMRDFFSILGPQNYYFFSFGPPSFIVNLMPPPEIL